MMSARTTRVTPYDTDESSSSFASEEPISRIRKIPDEVAQAANQNAEDTDVNELNDELVLAAFRLAVAKTDAEVGLLHRRTDAFLYTTAVHQLDAGFHLYVGLSFWDPAVQSIMRNNTVEGATSDGEEASAVARRLRSSTVPRFVLAIPVMIDGCIEAIIELGRSHSPFSEGTLRSTMKSLVAITA